FPQAISEFKSVQTLAPDRTEQKFYEAQAYSLLYIKSKNSKYKQEAKSILAGLETLSTPFPHSANLKKFLDTQ
ncbi:hypothetical protein HYY75_10695, partial [bacterium]|nr:hypothetical protein [bacterium]